MAVGPDPFAAVTAFNRFGLGARPGDLALAANDPRGFLLEELRAPGAGSIESGDLPSSAQALQMFFADQQQQRMAREMAAAAAATPMVASAAPADAKPMDPAMAAAKPADQNAMEAKPKPAEPPVEQRLFRAEAMARFNAQLKAQAGFVEKLVAFWSNHFAVSVAKGQFLRVTAGPFEREAIRPHVLGKFSQLLIAAESHPAMIFYLDNQRSSGPGSKAGRFELQGTQRKSRARNSRTSHARRRRRLHAGRRHFAGAHNHGMELRGSWKRTGRARLLPVQDQLA